MVVDVARFGTAEDQDSISHSAVEGERLQCPEWMAGRQKSTKLLIDAALNEMRVFVDSCG